VAGFLGSIRMEFGGKWGQSGANQKRPEWAENPDKTGQECTSIYLAD
jgi:hypothetical protein